jgi:hypothetical protein
MVAAFAIGFALLSGPVLADEKLPPDQQAKVEDILKKEGFTKWKETALTSKGCGSPGEATSPGAGSSLRLALHDLQGLRVELPVLADEKLPPDQQAKVEDILKKEGFTKWKEIELDDGMIGRAGRGRSRRLLQKGAVVPERRPLRERVRHSALRFTTSKEPAPGEVASPGLPHPFEVSAAIGHALPVRLEALPARGGALVTRWQGLKPDGQGVADRGAYFKRVR